MKTKLRLIFTMVLVMFCMYFIPGTETAFGQSTIARIEITKQPIKTTYTQGESLYLLDMVVSAYHYDGSMEEIVDYSVSGYDSMILGSQSITIGYEGASTNLTVQVIPQSVKNIKTIGSSKSSISLQWDGVEGATGYEIYSRDEVKNQFSYTTFVEKNEVTLEYESTSVYTYYITAVVRINDSTYTSALSEPFTAATAPAAVENLKATNIAGSSVSLSWDKVTDASGYIIYRATGSSGTYKKVATSKTLSYSDKTVSSGTAYRYRVRAYVLNDDYVGDISNTIQVHTNLAKMTIKAKAGEKQVRITWSKVNGATFYDLYMADESGSFKKITTRSAKSDLVYVAKGLSNGKTYTFYGVARRTTIGAKAQTPASNKVTATPVKLANTSTAPRIFKDKAAFLNSSAYKNIEFFRNNVIYEKSYVIPGIVNTNVGGFASTAMCPQGITFAKDYLLMTAYDMAKEEKSVIYIMDKSSRELLSTIVLTTSAHVGGIAFDGEYVWISVGTNVGAISYEVIEHAATEKKPYMNVVFEAAINLGIAASYMTVYENHLWVGSYNELESTIMNRYEIVRGEVPPTLTKVGSITMPTRVQGISFTNDGYLILSRSCQLYQGLRGYMRQIDVHVPDFSDVKGNYVLGDVVKTVEMPSMNEEIAIDGDLLYVNFESGAFTNASYRVDRISAFKLSSILPAK